MKRLLALSIALLLLLSISIPAFATESKWVLDEADVLTDETIAYINNLNEDVFSGYKNKPQLAMIIVKKLPYDIDEYKKDLFNKYGVGTKEENCGLLFVFAMSRF